MYVILGASWCGRGPARRAVVRSGFQVLPRIVFKASGWECLPLQDGWNADTYCLTLSCWLDQKLTTAQVYMPGNASDEEARLALSDALLQMSLKLIGPFDGTHD